MRVTMVTHASVIVEAGDVVMWTDPWLMGRAFNESWALWPEPPLEQVEAWLPRITHLFVSHEHPDHFHIPTLRWLPADFKKRVPVLFQRLHTDKMPDAFRRFGFKDVRTFRHRELAEISPGVRFYMFQEAPLDASCALIDPDGRVMLNLNDCEPSRVDRQWIRKDLGGHVDVLLNQFSIATYDGRLDVENVAPRHAARVLERMVLDHRGVNAAVSVPIASFMYFCKHDNGHLNQYRNSIQTTSDLFTREGLDLLVMRPFDSWEPGQPIDNTAALEYYRNLDDMPLALDPVQPVAAETVEAGTNHLFEDLRKYYPRLLLRMIGQLRLWVPDIGNHYVLDFRTGTMRLVGHEPGDWDLQLNSQPLHFALQQPYGFQTLSISGRFYVRGAERRFLLLRVITGLRNAEIYLKPRFLVSRNFLGFVARNFTALTTQFVSKLRLISRFVS
jgi:UDP-MurNAc hydroxylase